MAKVHLNIKAPKNEPKKKRRNKTGGGGSYSPLAPMTPAELRKQAQETIRAIYKPAFKQLGREESRLNAISTKRKADNAYYLNWLDKKSEQLQSHQDAADAAVLAAGQQASQETQKSYEDIRGKLVAEGEATPGVVSDPTDATAFDVSGQASRDQQLIESARNQTQGQINAIGDAATMSSASNFAFMAAQEAKRVSDQWEGLSKLGDAKQQLRLSRGADAAKEIARLLDREVQKSQIRGQLSASATQAALEAKRFGLDVGKLELDKAKLGFEELESGRKFGLEEKKYKEDVRWHNIEKNLKSTENTQEKQKESHKITAIIQEGISTIASNPNLNKMLEKDPQKVTQRLMKILGSATAAHAAVELVTKGKLTPTTRQSLNQIGYIVPPKWR